MHHSLCHYPVSYPRCRIWVKLLHVCTGAPSSTTFMPNCEMILRHFLHCLLNARHWCACCVMPHDVHLNCLSLPLVGSCDCRFLLLCPPRPQMHYHDHRMDYYDHRMDLTFKLHSQQLNRTLTLLGARSEWTQLHDKCQQIWLKSNLAHTRNILWDIDHSHWTHLYHRSNYFPGPQTHPSSQIIEATVYCLILGLVPAPEPILFEYSIFTCFILRPKFIQMVS